jgi:transcriptional regulator with XRE-family HTH domain
MSYKIGNQIRAMRKAHKLTQEEFAKRSGISLMSLRRYETDERQPTMDTVAQMATALGLSVEAFAWGDPNTGRSYFWYGDLEEKMKQVDCSIGGDTAEGYLWIKYPEGTLEVTEADLIELHESTNTFMRFKLDELRKKHAERFRGTITRHENE